MTVYWIPLLTAHVLGDFLLQPNWMSGEAKTRPGVLATHAMIHGALALFLLQDLALWPLSLPLILSHAGVDFLKTKSKSSPGVFALDQLAHMVVIALLSASALQIAPNLRPRGLPLMILTTGFVLAVFGAGHFIRTVSEQLSQQNPGLREALNRGLQNGGAMIGKLERALIFLLVLMGQPGGVGFLIAAKSIIRFEEAKKQPLAEYVLIGTLWSFGLSMAFAAGTLWLLKGGIPLH